MTNTTEKQKIKIFTDRSELNTMNGTNYIAYILCTQVHIHRTKKKQGDLREVEQHLGAQKHTIILFGSGSLSVQGETQHTPSGYAVHLTGAPDMSR